jgi:dihydroflavonol-4-reductase
VRALVRSEERGRSFLPQACELVRGDVTDAASLARALDGCEVVYHAAGLPEQWLPDPAMFVAVNVEGTRNLVEAALARGIRRFVYTSTIDVFAMQPGIEFDESALDAAPKGTAYGRSKQEADRVVTTALARGLPAVFLHPAGLYGPAPAASPGLNRAIAQIVRREMPLLLPGSVPAVYCHDVATGHLLAEERAAVGSRYILSDVTLSLTQFAEAVCAVAGRGRVPPLMPTWLAWGVAAGGEALARITRKPPLVSRGQVHFIGTRAQPTSRRIQTELGWKPTPLHEGLRATLDWMEARGEL